MRTPDLARRAPEQLRDLLAEVDLRPRRRQQPRRLGGLDLGVLRVVEAARQVGGQVGLQLAQFVRPDLDRVDPGGALAVREAP